MSVPKPIDPMEQLLWNYAHGRMDEDIFENWVYESTEFEARIGPEDYLTMLEWDFRNKSKYATYERAQFVRAIVMRIFPRQCPCLSLNDQHSHYMNGPSIVDPFSKTRARLTPWIELAECQDCGTYWLQGTDTDGDDYYLLRMSPQQVADVLVHDRWPTVFDKNPVFWPDDRWLARFGFGSLADWRAKNDPATGAVKD